MNNRRLIYLAAAVAIPEMAYAGGDPGVVYAVGINALLYLLAPIFAYRALLGSGKLVALLGAYGILAFLCWRWLWASDASAYVVNSLLISLVPLLLIVLSVKSRAQKKGKK